MFGQVPELTYLLIKERRPMANLPVAGAAHWRTDAVFAVRLSWHGINHSIIDSWRFTSGVIWVSVFEQMCEQKMDTPSNCRVNVNMLSAMWQKMFHYLSNIIMILF